MLPLARESDFPLPEDTAGVYPSVPARADFAAVEERVLRRWDDENTFQASVDQRRDADEFVFFDGPPFANGLPHHGHLLTGYVKDVVPRYKTMRGYRVGRRFGWDCHGLPAEMETERELGVRGRSAIREYGVEKFNARCRESVLQYTRQWRTTVTRQARWVDFDDDYKTMDLPYMESVMWAFRQLWDKGLVYRAFRVMPYSWGAETPLSNFEIRLDDATRPRQDPALTVWFETEPADDGLGALRLLAWTTTPWTLPSNLAVAVGPDVEYVVVRAARPNGGPNDGPNGGPAYVLGAATLAEYEADLTAELGEHSVV
ncbi:MAG TPA: isoleucine--tRNA ligase, partial [Acidimicrobiaceae bacterium]|nr:isoleucine--tRNA ligase [Acidimicrobiaceae bacterium]